MPPSSPFRRCAALLLALLTLSATAQTLAKPHWQGSGMDVEPWWSGAIFYQLDPLSFQDSDGDGFGDLRGIASRLDYLQSLGVDAIVLSPFVLKPPGNLGAPQPAFEMGDPAAPPFDPRLGGEADFDALVEQGSAHKVRVVIDLPLSPTVPEADLLNRARFWLSRGVAGLRLTADAASAPAGRPERLSAGAMGERLRSLQILCATFGGDRVLFWDRPDPPPETPLAQRSSRHLGRRRHRLTVRNPPSNLAALVAQPHLLIDPRLASVSLPDASALRGALVPWPPRPGASAPVAASDAPDRVRSFGRLGTPGADAARDLALAKILAAALLTGSRAAQVLFGQEIGMVTTPPGALGGGDPTPMQWGGDSPFSAGTPWMELGANAATANVALEDADPGSLLNWYRKLTALHHGSDALRTGSVTPIAASDPNIVAWVRTPAIGGNAASVIVAANLSPGPVTLSLGADLRRIGLSVPGGVLRTLASSAAPAEPPAAPPISVDRILLPAFSVLLAEINPHAGLESSPAPLRPSRRRPTVR